MDENNNEQEAPEKKEAQGGNRMIFFGLLAGVIILNAAVAFFMVQVTKPKNPEKIAAEAKEDSLRQVQEVATTMGATTAENPVEAVVNIAGTEGERFLKAAVIFEYDDQTYPLLGPELVRRAPKFKDLLIAHLSKLTLMEVTEPDAKETIRRNFVRLVNNSLPPKTGEIREVLFTQYIIQ